MKNDFDFKNCMHVYVAGSNPSARDIQNLCIMFESAIALSIFNINHNAKNENSDNTLNKEYTEFLREKYIQYDEYATNKII